MKYAALIAMAGLVACSSPNTGMEGADSGMADAGSVDAGAADAGTVDSGTPDAGASDAGTTDAGSADAGMADGGSADAGLTFVPGQPLTATPGQWTWIPFSDAYCADGSNTGIGVNLSATGSQVVIYLEGGGACWDELTCYTLMTAAHFTTGYKQADFMAEASDTSYLAEPGGFFDRTAAANPFKDASYVYIPYCTGDVHAGDNVIQYGAHTAMHVGARNFVAFLNRIVPTFPSATRVYIAGSSAGGFGATLNWWRTQQAFGSTRVDLIDDSGTFMPPDIESQASNSPSQWIASWNLTATAPPACTQCATDLTAIYSFSKSAMPNSRGALLTYNQDSVLPTYFGITEAQFEMGLQEDITNDFSGNLACFVFNSSGHVLWFNPTLTTNNVTLQQFLTDMVNDSPSWQNVHP